MRAASLRVLLQSAFVATLSGSAWAQMPPPPPPLPAAPAPAPAPAPVYQAPAPAPQYPAPQPAPVAQPPMQPMAPQPQPQPQFGAAVAAPAPAPAAAAGPVKPGDHDTWAVGHIGFGWYGTRSVPVAFGGTAAAPAFVTRDVPAIGVRIWFNPTLGLDIGAGVYSEGGSTKTDPGGVSTDLASGWAALLHGGLPIALLNANHYSFQITPELDIGFGSGSATDGGIAPNVTTYDTSGLLIQAGARAGAEIQFGFMGVPQLALDASVGMFAAMTSGKTTTTPPAPGVARTDSLSKTTVGTSQINSPWDIFRSNIAARYYF